MTRHLLCTAAILAFPALATPAFACSVSGTTVVCAGSNGNFNNNGDGLQILVESGATVSASSDAMKLGGDNVAIDNRGTIESTANDGIDAGGEGLTVTNAGAIRGAKDGIHAEDFVSIANTGTIDAADDGIQAGNGPGSAVVGIENAAGGRITADDKAITAGDGVWLVNAGQIVAGSEGFEAGNDARVTNSGAITAAEDGIQVGSGARILNQGVILSLGPDGDGIDIDDGDIVNDAGASIVVKGSAGIDYDAGGASTVENAGLIEGVEGIMVETGLDASGNPNGETANVAAQTITNSGTIRGTGGTALLLGLGADALELLDGAIIDGLSDFGGDDDRLAFVSLSYGIDGFASLFDGGAGTDTASFAFDISHLASAALSGEILTLAFDGGVGGFDLALKSFEDFVFDGTRYTLADLVPAVPLPAGAVLLGSALVALALRRRGGSRR